MTYSENYAHRTNQDSDFMGIYENSVDNFHCTSVSFIPFMAWVTVPKGTVFIMGPILIFFFPAPNMEKHLKRCPCFKLVPEHAGNFGQTCHGPWANGAALVLYRSFSVGGAILTQHPRCGMGSLCS